MWGWMANKRVKGFRMRHENECMEWVTKITKLTRNSCGSDQDSNREPLQYKSEATLVHSCCKENGLKHQEWHVFTLGAKLLSSYESSKSNCNIMFTVKVKTTQFCFVDRHNLYFNRYPPFWTSHTPLKGKTCDTLQGYRFLQPTIFIRK